MDHESSPPTSADFFKAEPPEGTSPEFDLASPKRFINRELSWLEFDSRVLDEAENKRHPLLERVRFLAISGENLDEFYTVRFAGLMGIARAGHQQRSSDGMAVGDQLEAIADRCHTLEERQQSVWTDLLAELREASILVLEAEDLTRADLEWLDGYFVEQVLPLLTPLAVDTAHPFPFIPNKGLVLAVLLRREAGSERDAEGGMSALLPIPHAVERFVRLPDRGETIRFLRVESLILHYVERLFPGYRKEGAGLFRMLRDSDIEIEEEADDLVREFETALKRRRRGDVIQFRIEARAPLDLKRMVIREIAVPGELVFERSGMIGFTDLKGLIVAERSDLLFRSYNPRMPERVRDHDGDIFKAIQQKDMLLHHPYESFEIVVKFLQQAARDSRVAAIRQTLYRTSKDSPIVAALVEAAEAGKSVTAVVELKARFDEAANISLSRQLERAGVQVVFGFVNWKTHAKISLVVRREGDRLVSYTHFGTGNYHPITARIYTDLALFSCDLQLGKDAASIFNFITGYAEPQNLESTRVSPINLKSTLIACIETEIAHAEAGRPAAIWGKANSLAHPEVIDALYRASQAGVRVDLVVRGICSLRPGIAGLSENIRVKSIVGRFLEHSRIMCFGSGGGLPSESARIFISSADWMERNLDRRVETLVEIHNPTVRAQILDQIMAANLRDEAQSWILQPDGSYQRFAWTDEGRAKDSLFSCHDFFMRNPSLSGRGRTGAADAPRLTAES